MQFFLEIFIFFIYIFLIFPFSIIKKILNLFNYKKNTSYFIKINKNKSRYTLIDAKSDNFYIKNLSYGISGLISFIISKILKNSTIFKLKDTMKESNYSFEDIYPMF